MPPTASQLQDTVLLTSDPNLPLAHTDFLLLTSAKLCQETEVTENSRQVEENASQITPGFFLSYLHSSWSSSESWPTRF